MSVKYYSDEQYVDENVYSSNQSDGNYIWGHSFITSRIGEYLLSNHSETNQGNETVLELSTCEFIDENTSQLLKLLLCCSVVLNLFICITIAAMVRKRSFIQSGPIEKPSDVNALSSFMDVGEDQDDEFTTSFNDEEFTSEEESSYESSNES